MGKPWTEQQIQRWSRELSGHAKDKDRARRRRRLTGEGLAAPARPRDRDAPDDDELAEALEAAADSGDDEPDEASN